MKSLKINHLFHLTRRFNPHYPTHKAILTISIGLFSVFFTYLSLIQGISSISLKLSFDAAIACLLSWALARELDPDHEAISLFAALVPGLTTAVSGPVAVLLIIWLIFSLRFINHSPGKSPLPLDSVIIMMSSLYLSFRFPLMLLFTSQTFLYDLKHTQASNHSLKAGLLSLLLLAIGLTTGLFILSLVIPPPHIVIYLLLVSLWYLRTVRRQTRVVSLTDTGAPYSLSRLKISQLFFLQFLLLFSLISGKQVINYLLPIWMMLAVILVSGVCRRFFPPTPPLKGNL